MSLVQMKSAIAGVWVAGACALAIVSNVTSIGGWTAVVALGLLPPLVLLRVWNNPAPTMSESIAAARR